MNQAHFINSISTAILLVFILIITEKRITTVCRCCGNIVENNNGFNILFEMNEVEKRDIKA